MVDGTEAVTQGGTAMLALSSRPRLSIVVLPFTNLSGDPEQDYFVDRATESLTTDLSRISASFVIGRPALHEHGKSSRQRAEHFDSFGPKNVDRRQIERDPPV
jgi:TolB-like protein